MLNPMLHNEQHICYEKKEIKNFSRIRLVHTCMDTMDIVSTFQTHASENVKGNLL